VKRFAELFLRLDASNKTNAKVEALVDYFRAAPPGDAAWAVQFFTHKRPRTAVNANQLRAWAAEAADLPLWLLEECHGTVGDLAETVSLLLPPPTSSEDSSLQHWVEERLIPLAKLSEDERKAQVFVYWQSLDEAGRFVFTKLITGGWRLGVSHRLVVKALAEAFSMDPDVTAHRLMGSWTPGSDFYELLQAEARPEDELVRPYPFFLAYPFEDEPESLGPVDDWAVEWKWDGIRAQCVRREDVTALWSRGEDLSTQRFPEIAADAAHLPGGTVLDGEILAWKDEVLSFSHLQRRLGRKEVSKKLLAEVPVVFLAYDLLEHAGRDIRKTAYAERRRLLEEIIEDLPPGLHFRLSPLVTADTWSDFALLRQESRARRVEGFMLKARDSVYGVGRKKGGWWKWKVEPYTVDAVLLYAQRGSGRRAGLYTDYTFGVWEGEALVPFAKAYSGLTDAEIRSVDAFVRKNTLERFGPVRSVPPKLVMEIAFEDIRPSSRHKSGLAVRFPRIARLREDKAPAEADSLETVKALLQAAQGTDEEGTA
jgi:DNA ligase-1